MESRTKKCYLVGYCPNGYRLWCPMDGKVIQGRDVKFDESKFYKTKEFGDWSTSENEENNPDFNSSVSHNEMEDSSGDDIEGNEEAEEIRQDKAAEEESEIFEPRHSQRERRKPGYLNDYVAFAMSAEAFIEDIPKDYEEVKRRSDKGKWNEAITEEIRVLEENGTWTLTKLPPGKKLIDNKWVFKIK